MKAAVWVRVSTQEQEAGNQVPAIEAFASQHGHEIAIRYVLDDDACGSRQSAWSDGADYRAALKCALDDAWQGKYQVLIVWALDRLTRRGAEDALRLIRKFRECGVAVVSVQESWLNGSPEVQDLLVSFAGWQAQQESKRQSERVKAGLARRKAKGLPVGRQPGAKAKARYTRAPRKRAA